MPIESAWLGHLGELANEMAAGRHPRAAGERVTQERLGELLAQAVGRKTAWSKASISRFLSGTQPSDDLLMAFSAFFGLPHPLLSARSPEEVYWFEVGRELRERSPEDFARLMAHALARRDVARQRDDLLDAAAALDAELDSPDSAPRQR